MTYGELNGIWHVLSDGTALCGAETGKPVELDEEPGRCAGDAERRPVDLLLALA